MTYELLKRKRGVVNGGIDGQPIGGQTVKNIKDGSLGTVAAATIAALCTAAVGRPSNCNGCSRPPAAVIIRWPTAAVRIFPSISAVLAATVYRPLGICGRLLVLLVAANEHPGRHFIDACFAGPAFLAANACGSVWPPRTARRRF